MKTKVAVAFAMLMLVVSAFWAQTHQPEKPVAAPPALGVVCGLDRSDMQDELKDLGVYTVRMQSRIVMVRNSAGIVENPQLRNALQVDADMWQDELDHLKQRMTRLQAAIDRCEAREKINQSTK
ncbi:MAG TPA: hypothetical protein VG897_08450 [Terriglobales bacterium]|nr:hypothetical protein [Terriglobales bacterium]